MSEYQSWILPEDAKITLKAIRSPEDETECLVIEVERDWDVEEVITNQLDLIEPMVKLEPLAVIKG